MAKKSKSSAARSARRPASRAPAGRKKKKTSARGGTATRKTVRKKTSKSKKKKPTRGKTAKKTTTKKAAKKTSAAKPAASKKKKKKKPTRARTYLTRRELTQFKKMLLIKRAELLGDLNSISEEALHAESTDLSHMPIHMADVGSDNYGKELMLGLAESERRTIREIDDALQRIVDGAYGICQATGKRITKARLNAKPWAKYCIEAAREMERNNNNHNHY